jgi:hypothetical protein
MLAEHGISIIGPDAIKAFIGEVQALRDFPPKDLFERSGWGILQFPRQYVLSDGSPFAPQDTAKAPIAFQPARGKCHTAGDLKGWKNGVVKPLKHQPLPLFAIMLAFAPMLLRLTDRVNNLAFEYTGPKGTGKSTVQQLAASVIGSPGYGGERAYGITFDDFAAFPEQQMAAHADALMIVDGADVYFAGETPARRAGRFKAFLTRIGPRGSNAQGAIGGNQGMMCLISAEAPLSTLNGTGTDVAAASAALLITYASRPINRLASLTPSPMHTVAAVPSPTRWLPQRAGIMASPSAAIWMVWLRRAQMTSGLCVTKSRRISTFP